MKPMAILPLMIIWVLGMSPEAWAGGLPNISVQPQLDQILAGTAQIKLAVPVAPALRRVAPVPDAPVDFKFNPGEVKDKDAIIISVCGLNFSAIGVGGFQVEMVLELYHRLFPDRKIDDPTVRKIVQELSDDADAPDVSALLALRDDYMEAALQEQLAGAKKKFLIVPMPWTRNPQKSGAAIADFKAWLAQVYDAARRSGKPVYVVAHSWGTLLMYDALGDLAAQGSPIRVDKFVTLGSPLVPRPWWVKLFAISEEHFQGLERKVAKPANVKTWINFWAKHDQFSNSIPAADGGNSRVDAPADPLAAMILRADPIFNKSAAKDLAALNSIASWHGSYMSGYHRFFASISQPLDIDVFGPEILPKL
jgi:pimeloyl-ACP methyl ester carboxylesterase